MEAKSRQIALVVVLAVIGSFVGLHTRATVSARSSGGGLTAAQRAGALSFAPGTNPSDEAFVTGIIASTRVEARRLIDRVDGAVTITVGPVGQGDAIGLTHYDGHRYVVTLDLGFVNQHGGQRGMSQLVLHELGHVVDSALVPRAIQQQLDAAIPEPYPCVPGEPAQTCAGRSDPEERFAETFRKWASGDIGIGVDAGGYRVSPPASLEAWGAPLVALAR